MTACSDNIQTCFRTKQDFPIGIKTYERPEYLRQTIESLKRCHGIDISMIHIFDDNSKSLEKIKLLEKYKLEGINIHAYSKIGPLQIKVTLWNELFSLYPNTDIICDFDDDIILYKGFIGIINRLKEIRRLGILSLHYWRGKFARMRPKGWKRVDYVGSPCWVGTRRMYDACRDELSVINDVDARRPPADRIFTTWCTDKGLGVATTTPSYAQHIGDISAVNPKEKEGLIFRCKDFVGEDYEVDLGIEKKTACFYCPRTKTE